MVVRNVGRWFSIFVIGWTTAGAVASCGSSANSSTFDDGGLGDGSAPDGTTGVGNEAGSFFSDGGEGGAGNGCKPKTCAEIGYTCGQNSDGCGNVLNCGTCQLPAYCGGGGFSKCGGTTEQQPDGAPVCTPTTCQALGYTCGPAGDGCGGTLDCGMCNSPQYCGGAGFAQCGGNNGLQPDGGTPCTPQTCASLTYTCGAAGDGCGSVLQCGTCTAPQYCGGGGFNQCGGNTGVAPDGGVMCTPTTCAKLGYNCGVAGDGCGNALTCGTCTAPQYCGGGGFDMCGGDTGIAPDGSVLCTPETCKSQGYTCGTAGDGCGGTLSCGTCTDPQFCGGGGANKCGGNNGLGPDGGVACTPTTCAKLGYTCGPAGDGCGNLLQCGTCNSPQYCGGGGYEVCGPTSVGTCSGGGSTTLSGFVYDPANHLPVYNALVYAPVGAVQIPATGVSAATCGCSSPPAFASAYTSISGAFTLTGVPSGTNVTIVVQLGKWQRAFTENITACQANTLAANLTLPSTSAQGNIPRFAIDTGGVDAMECVLLKMGIAQSEFGDPNLNASGIPQATQRIHLYQGEIVAGGAVIDGNTPPEKDLTETLATLESYDVALFPCQGGAGAYDSANGYPNTLGNLVSYTSVGGRAFMTHFHYDMLDGNGSFSGSANWNLNANSWGNYYSDTKYNADIQQAGFPKGVQLADWLNQPVVYGGTLGVIPVGVIRQDFNSVNAPSQLWLYTAKDTPGGPPANVPIHYTFDTPFNQSPTCGRVVYSDFHVESQPTSTEFTGDTFPNECPGGTAPSSMTPQEELLEFMLFDLTSCVSPPTCTPQTCVELGYNCGQQGDGCGGTLSCGACTAPNTCGGGGKPGVCGYPDAGSCSPQTCVEQKIGCGPAGDGCGNEIQCGPCTSPQTCGGGGVAGQCGFPDGGSCQPETCSQQKITCGPAGDGCGNEIQCGTCTPPQTCGGGGVSGQCGAPDAGSCTPRSCAQQSIGCGPAGDGCGNELQCGTCTPPQTCGGGGVPGQCGVLDSGTCAPQTCQSQGIQCGPAGDGCGNLIQCGTCTSPQTCGGGSVPGQCGGGTAQ